MNQKDNQHVFTFFFCADFNPSPLIETIYQLSYSIDPCHVQYFLSLSTTFIFINHLGNHSKRRQRIWDVISNPTLIRMTFLVPKTFFVGKPLSNDQLFQRLDIFRDWFVQFGWQINKRRGKLFVTVFIPIQTLIQLKQSYRRTLKLGFLTNKCTPQMETLVVGSTDRASSQQLRMWFSEHFSASKRAA